MAGKVKYTNHKNSDFYLTVKKRVDAYFEEKGISKHANTAMVIKTLFILSGLCGSYFLLVFGNISSPWIYVDWMILGFFCALVGLNICHDAIHGGLSSNKKVNKVLGMLFNVVGANAYMWSIMHNIVHHTYPNVPDHDEDLEVAPIIRLSPTQKLWKIHRYQHIYAVPLYFIASLSWVFIKDYKKFFQKKIGNYDNKTHPSIEYFNLFFFKAVYYTLFIVVPFTVIEMSWWQILIGFIAMHAIEGYTLALVFMLAHVVDETHFPIPDQDGKIDNSWAAHQMYTTANFARNNPIANFICGGLNYQIEHHLFPLICHIHYIPLSKIVQETANEFNLPYYDNPTFMGAMKSHIRFLKKNGRGEELPG